jgi:hypothetical protein
VNQSARPTIASVLSQKTRHSVPRHLRKDWKTRFESMFPINPEAEAIYVELLTPGKVSNPKRWHHALLWILIGGHPLTPSIVRLHVAHRSTSHPASQR